MHKCLLVPEIVSTIFAQLGKLAVDEEAQARSPSPTKPTRSTLLSLALSCQTFTEIALDVLWRDISSVCPLLDCLPVNVIKEPNGTVLIGRPLGPEDFIVFQKYARRVHSIGYRARIRSKYEPRVLRILSNFPREPGSALLPNLKLIVWKADDDESILFFRNLVPRTLVSLYLVGSLWPQSKVTLVSFLHKHFPNIKEFRCLDPPPEVSHHISEFVCHAENLSSLATGPLSEKAMKHLMRSEALKDLNIRLPDNHSWDRVQGSFLPSLTYFRLRGSRLGRALEYLTHLRLSSAQVCIDFSVTESGTSIAQFLKLLVISFDNEKLSKLEYTVDNALPIRPIFELPVNALDPLSRFKNLTTLSLENFYTPFLNDVKVTQMARSWPYLRTLKIGTGENWCTDAGTLVHSQMTLYGVAYVAQHCQKLQVLGLVFDSLAPPTAAVPESWTNPGINFLDVGASTCSTDNVGQVTSLIAQLFPKLHAIGVRDEQTTSPLPGSRGEAWKVVMLMSKRYVEMQDAARRKAMKEAREELRKDLGNMGHCCRSLGDLAGNNEGEGPDASKHDEKGREN